MKWILPEKKSSNLIDSLFESRGIKDKERFLSPSFEHLISPFEMYGVDKAVKVICEAIKQNKKIYIHGDFDVDGITATSIMWNFLYRDLKSNVIPFIPNRFTDGYGLSEENIEKIIAEGGNLIISVDCGIKDIELVNKYSNQIDFIISDHHTIRKYDGDLIEGAAIQVGEFIVSSKAKAVVHPQLSQSLSFKEICGAFVSWKICAGLSEYMRTGIDMSKYLDLVALGTICDVMPLVDENRVVVKLGIEKMRRTENPGLKMLLSIAGIDITKVTAYHLGYMIGPRLNASGRLESAMDAVKLLTTQSHQYALVLAKKLDGLNKSRQELTKKYLEVAEEQLIENGLENKIHFLYGEDWPEGIVGLIAGRLTEKYNKPVLVGSLKDGVIKGSARSISTFNIANALKDLNGYLIRYGGHAQAAGFALKSEFQSDFTSQLVETANTLIKDEDLEKSLVIDSLAAPNDLSIQTAKDILGFEPFGNHNNAPLFALLSLKLRPNIKVIGKDQSHAKFCIDCDSEVECIFFNFKGRFDALLSSSNVQFDIAGNIDIDSWNGKEKVVFKVKEMRISE